MKNLEESSNSMENQNDTQVSADSNVSKERIKVVDGFEHTLCDFCEEVATRGVIGLRDHKGYCDDCYQKEYNWRKRNDKTI